MELKPISQVSKQFDVSPRTLRYYEQIGLIMPEKTKGLTRIYNENTVLRLRNIIILRKLRIPLTQIAEILDSGNIAVAIEVFQQNLTEIEDEINALSTIKGVIQSFITRLNIETRELQLLDDESLLEIVDSLTISKINFKEEKVTMEKLNQANETLNKLTDREVRIAYLPPVTVASIHCMGEPGDAEAKTGNLTGKFVNKTDLRKIKTDMRHYGFDHKRGNEHGYERWLTIPADMEVEAPFEKKQFSGGIYAGYSIWFKDFIQAPWEAWKRLYEWADSHAEYEIEKNLPCFEEHLNDMRYFIWTGQEGTQQLDLLIPIKKRK